MSHDEPFSVRQVCVLNGAARFARDRAVRLARRGHDVHVVAPATSMRAQSGIEFYDGQAVRVHRLRSIRWPFHEWLRVTPPWEVRRQVRRIVYGLAGLPGPTGRVPSP